MNNKIAEIIPLRRLTRNLTVFDYIIPANIENDIKKGQLVQISFQKTDYLGVVIKIKNKTNIANSKLKSIKKIIQKKPIITEEQFKLIEWMKDYYFIAPSIVLKSMIPVIPNKQLENVKLLSIQNTFVSIPNKLVFWLQKEVNIFIKSKENNFFNYSDILLHFALYIGIIKKLLRQNKIILILFPDIKELNNFYSNITSLFSNEKIALIHSRKSQKLFYYEWKKIYTGKARIILGTKIACFLPFQKLNTIIVHLEEDENHKNADQNPRYHVREIAIQLVEIYHSKLLYTNQTPSLELWNDLIKQKINQISSPTLPTIPIKLISMEKEINNKNFSGISENLQESIANTLEQKKSVFLFLNRRGEARALICKDCSYIIRCSNCNIPFTIHEKNYLLCYHCNNKIPILLECPECKGTNLKMIGQGISSIEKKVKKLFPDIEVSRIDKDSKTKEWKNITMGTEYAINNYSAPKNLGLIGIISIDSLLHLPDFRSEEKTYQLINKIAYFPAYSVPIIAQTYSPDNKAIKMAIKQDFPSFAKEESANRKSLHWPPYWQLYKLIYKNKDEKLAKKEAEQLTAQLKQAIKKEDLIEIAGPNPSYPPKVRGNFPWIIILKSKNGHTEKLKELIKLVPESWIIDVDPITLF